MATSNSSTDDDGEFELTSPGQRTGEGSGSVLPYLHKSLASRPGELVPADYNPEQKPVRSLAHRVCGALLSIRKKKK